MTARLDEEGRLTLPADLRDRLGLRPGDDVELTETPQGLTLHPAEQHEHLREVNGVLVWDGPGLSDDPVQLIRIMREERHRQIMGPGDDDENAV